jgi:holo-[acyl-carrier protein] synthase
MHILGIGTDIIECLRIAKMIERHGERFTSRVFTPQEIEYCATRRAANQHYAGRWAAKEAILKALGTGWVRGVNWTDIEIRNEPGGKPTTAFRGGVRDLVASLGVTDILLSISHSRNHAVAYAMAICEDRDE